MKTPLRRTIHWIMGRTGDLPLMPQHFVSGVLIPMEMTSKCSKLCCQTTCLWLVVSLEFWTFWRHFWDREEYRPWLVPQSSGRTRREQRVIARDAWARVRYRTWSSVVSLFVICFFLFVRGIYRGSDPLEHTSSHFAAFFLTAIVMVFAAYVVYHNRQKVW